METRTPSLQCKPAALRDGALADETAGLSLWFAVISLLPAVPAGSAEGCAHVLCSWWWELAFPHGFGHWRLAG